MKRKGRFAKVGLPYASAYLRPVSRKRVVLLGGGLAAIPLLAIAIDLTAGKGQLLAPGRVSSEHSMVESRCSECHAPGRPSRLPKIFSRGSVVNENCTACHDGGARPANRHSGVAHATKWKSSPKATPAVNEDRCVACHSEHGGRSGEITERSDRTCHECHHIGSFAEKHPEFDCVVEGRTEKPGLYFSHARHVAELRRESAPVEEACNSCHTLDSSRRRYQPIGFDAHCTDCHLGTEKDRVSVRVRSGERPELPGVETVEMIRARMEPDPPWTLAERPSEYEITGGTIAKTRVRHADPWILENAAMLGKLREVAPPASVAAIDDVIGTLTGPCRLCHVLEGGRIAPVQADQRVLSRATFNHGPHLIQVGCLKCHDQIRIEALMTQTGAIAPRLDNAGILNIPGIENCRGCHSEQRAASNCVTCHGYHPGEGSPAEHAARLGELRMLGHES